MSTKRGGYIIFKHDCGEILYIYTNDGDERFRGKYRGVPTPQMVQEYNLGFCPKCGGKLADKPKYIIVKHRREVDIDEIKRRFVGK